MSGRTAGSATSDQQFPDRRSGRTTGCVNFMVTPCNKNIQHFNFQLMHTMLKNVELLKHFIEAQQVY